MIVRVEEDSIKKIARDVEAASDEVNVFEIEARLSSLLSYSRFKVAEANDQVEHINAAIDDIEDYNDSTDFIVQETKNILENVSEEFAELGIPSVENVIDDLDD